VTLTKAHLVNRIYERCGLAKKEAQEIVEIFFNEMKSFLKDGKSIKISGFGNFNVKYKRARRGRNPQTGEAMMISERRVLTFSVSQVFKELLNKSGGDVTQDIERAMSHDDGDSE
jgi:integration host factor subunit alpha